MSQSISSNRNRKEGAILEYESSIQRMATETDERLAAIRDNYEEQIIAPSLRARAINDKEAEEIRIRRVSSVIILT